MPLSALTERSPIELDLPGERISVRVRESARARTARVLVGARRPLEVIVPASTRDEAVQALLMDKRDWIIDKLRVTREAAARPAVLGLDRSGVVHLADHVISTQRRHSFPPSAVLRGGVLVVGGSDEQATKAVERWYRREASRIAKQLISEHSPLLGVEVHSVAIRDPATRWGSCSPLGNLSFSWRLALAPPPVFEYVVMHELCHMIEPNHSRAFWRLLDSVHPGWRSPARWLQDHGHELHEYRAAVAVEGLLAADADPA